MRIRNCNARHAEPHPRRRGFWTPLVPISIVFHVLVLRHLSLPDSLGRKLELSRTTFDLSTNKRISHCRDFAHTNLYVTLKISKRNVHEPSMVIWTNVIYNYVHRAYVPSRTIISTTARDIEFNCGLFLQWNTARSLNVARKVSLTQNQGSNNRHFH